MTDEQARKHILKTLDIEVHSSADMPDTLRARILANLPSREEIDGDRWQDRE